MPQYAELEFNLHRRSSEIYGVLLRFSRPDSEAEQAPVLGEAEFDLTALTSAELDSKRYAQLLSESLFADEKILAFYRQVKQTCIAVNFSLRIRLFIGQDVLELHALRWELLLDPEDKNPLAFQERYLLSRYIDSHDWRPVRLRPKAALQALLSVAGGSNLADYDLAPIDVQGELDRTRQALRGMPLTQIGGPDKPSTLDAIIEGARSADVVYLACHGAIIKGTQPVLYLEDEQGRVKGIKGEELAQRIQAAARQPRLWVLASCESAGNGENLAAQAALAPLLNAAGVPAVLAMQGQISMDSIAEFMPRFFSELLIDGQLDRALSVARATIQTRPDAWMPALFLRLKGGRLWYEPGFGGSEEEDFPKWQAILNSISKHKCTPIIGSGVAEHVYGRMDDLARELAHEHGFPLSSCQSNNLPEVSQFISKDQSEDFARDRFRAQMRNTLLKLNRDRLSADAAQQPLPKLLKQVSDEVLTSPQEPHRILAGLKCPLYITANPDHLLMLALKDAETSPQTAFCPWKRNPDPEELYQGQPSVDAPLVYHILGHFRDEDSLVLTEDDYFQYLIGATSNKALIPPVVRAATSNSALLFLGFQLTDWSFRVLFRLIMSQEGGRQRDRFAHVAVQLDPEEHQLLNPKKARAYLERYFQDQGNFSIYWGTAADFLAELKKRAESMSFEDSANPRVHNEADDWE